MPLVAAAVVTLAAVGVLSARGEPRPRHTPARADTLWSGTATLLQTPHGQLTLCGGGLLTSLPPAGCGGAVVRGLDPMTVKGAIRYPNGTITTPSVRLTGTWDGHTLTVTRHAVLAEPDRSHVDNDVPGPSCPPPAGGWPFDKVDMAGWGRVQTYIRSQPDAGSPRVDKSQRIFTVPFTADLDRHRAEIAKLYDGPICVEHVQRSEREMRDLFTRVEKDLKGRGLQLLSGDAGGSGRSYVQASVVAVSPEDIAEIEHAYDGGLQLDSFLTPVSGKQ